MRRRDFIAVVGGAAAWPLALRAQTSRRIGLLFATSGQGAKARGLLGAVVQGLSEHGWVEGQNIDIVYRFADGQADVLPNLATELVQLRVEANVTDSTAATLAAKKATSSIPIVAISNDPVGSSLVASINRPGGNITGLSILSSELAGRRLQLISEIVPGLARAAVLSNGSNPSHGLLVKQTKASGQALGIEIYVAEAAAPDQLDSAFATIVTARVGALIVCPDAMLFGQHARVVAFTVASRLPALFPERQVVEAGGLLAYGPNIIAAFRQTAAYVDKILRGSSPADLPIDSPTAFELAINLKTAKALGLTIPDKLLSTADEVIE